MTVRSGRMLTGEEEQQIKAIYEVGGFSAVKIANAYRCSNGLVYSAIKRQGGKIRSRKPFTPEEEQQIVAIYEVDALAQRRLLRLTDVRRREYITS